VGTVVFFVVRSDNDVRQKWANATVKVFSLCSDRRLYNQANQLSSLVLVMDLILGAVISYGRIWNNKQLLDSVVWDQ
jgi:hypothetical protein